MNLTELKTEQGLKKIIIEEMGYDAAVSGGLELNLPSEVVGKILEKKVIASHGGFEVIFVKIKFSSGDTVWKKDASMRGTERSFISAIPRHERDAKLFVFCSEDGKFWH